MTEELEKLNRIENKVEILITTNSELTSSIKKLHDEIMPNIWRLVFLLILLLVGKEAYNGAINKAAAEPQKIVASD